MNNIESVFLCAGASILILYLYFTFRSVRMALLLAAAIAAPVYLSLERASQLLTLDELYIIREPLDLRNSDLGQWHLGGLRTTDAIVGLFASVLSLFPDLTFAQRAGLAKAFHWLLGLGCLIWVHFLADRYFVRERVRWLFALLFFCGGFFVPTNILALKVFNYDLLAMLLTVAAILYAYGAITQQSIRCATGAVIVATLAAQEKLVASPVLIGSLSAYAYVRHGMTDHRFPALMLARGVLVGLGLSACVGAVTWLMVAALRAWNLENFPPAGLLDHLVAWAWPVISFTIGYKIQDLTDEALRAIFLVRLGLTFLITYGLAQACSRWMRPLRQNAAKVHTLMCWTNAIALVAIFIVGAAGTYYVSAYWAPYHPIQPGNYLPTGEFNDATLHFGAESLSEHVALFVVFAYTVFVNTLPSAVWAGLAGVLTTTVFGMRRGREVDASRLGVELMLTAALLIPLAFGLGQVPVGNRYLNIAVFMVVLASVAKVATLLADVPRLSQVTYATAFMGLLLWELFPFRPLYAAFRPFWANYNQTYNVTPVVGALNPSWMGWGEEVMLAGQEVRRRCSGGDATLNAGGQVPCSAINLYSAYPGNWLDQGRQVNVILMPFGKRWELDDDYRYTDQDYYVINRSSIAQQYQKFPAGVEPEFVIQFRGFVQAWVFRGDRLKAVDFEF